MTVQPGSYQTPVNLSANDQLRKTGHVTFLRWRGSSTPVRGCQPAPMVLRIPDAQTTRAFPPRLARRIIAFSWLDSSQALQVEPTLM